MSVLRRILRPTLSFVRCASNEVVYTHQEGIIVPPHRHDNLPLPIIFVEALEKYSTRKCTENALTRVSRTYADVLDHSMRCAGKLKAIGVKPGDNIMLYSTNIEDFTSVLIGLISVGAIPCLANPAYTVFELSSLCALCDIKYLICCDTNTETAKSVSVSSQIPLLFSVDHLTEWITGAEPINELHDADPKSTVVIGFSSGTTGLPKGVEISHFALTKQRLCLDHPEITAITFDTPIISLLPFYHAVGFNTMNITINGGGTLNVFPHFDPAKYLGEIEKYKVDQLTLVPPLILFLAKHPIVSNYDLSSVKTIFTGAAPLSASLVSDVMTRLPNIEDIRQGYGLTEVTCAATFQMKGCKAHGSVGVLLPEFRARIVDPDTEEPVALGEVGEILLSGPTIMNGYYNNPRATAETITPDGWVKTGDMGWRDEAGIFWISDRLKELIKVKGHQVAPAELEAVLITHPLISDAAVIAIPDKKAGEMPKAFVTKVPGAQLSDEDVKSYIASKLSHHKHLAEVEFMDEIPKLPSGKILRKDLRAAEAAKRS